MAAVAPARSLAVAGLALVLGVGSGIALAPQAAADNPTCVTSKSQETPVICAPMSPAIPNTGPVGGGLPSEQDLTSANEGRHH
jgi:hypothetical protein